MKSCVVLSCLPKLKHNILRYRKAFVLDFCSDAGTAEFYTERIRLFERVKVVWFFLRKIPNSVPFLWMVFFSFRVYSKLI